MHRSAARAPHSPKSTLGDLKPPRVTITHAAPGFVFVAEKQVGAPPAAR